MFIVVQYENHFAQSQFEFIENKQSKFIAHELLDKLEGTLPLENSKLLYYF